MRIRDGPVGPKPFYAAIGAHLDGRTDIVAMTVGDGNGDSAKYWLGVVTGPKLRCVRDVFYAV